MSKFGPGILRLNTLQRLLTEEDVCWKHFARYFLQVSNMRLGKLTLALHYSPRQIDRDIPTFYKVLIAWHKHQHLHTRSHIPSKLADILNEPLFQNELITVDNQPLTNPDKVSSGITQIKDICYEAIPGYLPMRAIHKLLTEQEDNNSRTLFRTTCEFNELKSAIPPEWTISKNILIRIHALSYETPTQIMLHQIFCPVKPALFMDNFSKINRPLYQL